MSDASDQSNPGRKKNMAGRVANKRSATDPGWELWLDRQIHQLYDPVLSEEIPPELHELLLRFDDKPSDGDDRK